MSSVKLAEMLFVLEQRRSGRIVAATLIGRGQPPCQVAELHNRGRDVDDYRQLSMNIQ